MNIAELGHKFPTRLTRTEESTWDLVVFVGADALGPLGSAQTILLAIINILMQLVFVGIAVFNFTEPDIDEDAIDMACRCSLCALKLFFTLSTWGQNRRKQTDGAFVIIIFPVLVNDIESVLMFVAIGGNSYGQATGL